MWRFQVQMLRFQDQMQQSKLNFLAAQDAIDAHNSQPGVPYKQGLNKFSIMVQLNQ